MRPNTKHWVNILLWYFEREHTRIMFLFGVLDLLLAFGEGVLLGFMIFENCFGTSVYFRSSSAPSHLSVRSSAGFQVANGGEPATVTILEAALTFRDDSPKGLPSTLVSSSFTMYWRTVSSSGHGDSE